MLKRYCDICGRPITDRYVTLRTNYEKEHVSASGCEIGDRSPMDKEMCVTCYNKFFDVFQKFVLESSVHET